MKKLIAAIAIVAGILGIVFAFGKVSSHGVDAEAYLRVHIRADSNEAEAQAVKYQVRDAVVAYLTPIVASCETKAEAMEKIEKSLGGIERTATGVLRKNGFSYGARASVRREEFPTRVYDGVTLDAGVYDALILELGSGKGDNWWCVVYPPLCFTGAQNVVYKSKIAEIIKNFFG